MKGGNWVPADMIYSSVDTNRLKKLVDTAVDANFNILANLGRRSFCGQRATSAYAMKEDLWCGMIFCLHAPNIRAIMLIFITM